MTKAASITAQLANLNEHELRRLLVEHLTKQKLGLVWEHNAIERDKALNNAVVLPRLRSDLSCRGNGRPGDPYRNLLIEGDNFDALRLLKTTHANKVRVIYIDPPYNTGNKDWVYNDRYVGENDRWRHSLWLEFMYQRLTLARDLLSPDGVIMVSINDENRSRLEMLMDEVFPGMRVGSLVWRTKDTGNDSDRLLSQVHEHVLVYSNPAFRFNGRPTDRSKFRNPDDDPRGDWAPRPITKAHDWTVRENTYYPIQDPDTGLWYPCDPDSVWRFASELKKSKKQKLRSETIEELIRQKLIYFPPCRPDEVMLFRTTAELRTAIVENRGPILPKKKTPLLRLDLPDLNDWVGRPIAPGRPSRKDFWNSKPAHERLAPLSSWIGGANEEVDFNDDDDLEAPEVLRSTRGGVANDEIKDILGGKVFSFPKPKSLLKALLSQATKPGDIVLDFFAGSATTAHAVLELNAEDAGNRTFILCSSTEATESEPGKNVCRDVCAERVRRVIQGNGKTAGLPGDFAYISLEKLDPADARLDASTDQAFQLLSIRSDGCARELAPGPVKVVHRGGDLAVVYLPTVNDASIKALMALKESRLAVYSARPQTIAEKLNSSGKRGNSYAIGDVIMAGQAGTTGAGQ